MYLDDASKQQVKQLHKTPATAALVQPCVLENVLREIEAAPHFLEWEKKGGGNSLRKVIQLQAHYSHAFQRNLLCRRYSATQTTETNILVFKMNHIII